MPVERRCAVLCCGATTKQSSLFTFPWDDSEIERRKLWCQNLRISLTDLKPSTRVCSLHFSDNQFKGGQRKQLTSTAVPRPQNLALATQSAHPNQFQTQKKIYILKKVQQPRVIRTRQIQQPLSSLRSPLVNYAVSITGQHDASINRKINTTKPSTVSTPLNPVVRHKEVSIQQLSSLSSIAHVKTSSSSCNVSEQPSDDFDSPIVIVAVQGSVGDKNKGLSKKNEILANLELKHNILCSSKKTSTLAVNQNSSTTICSPRKRKQELDLRSEFIQPLKKSAKNVASTKEPFGKPSANLLTNYNDKSCISDHDYFQTGSNETSNEPNKENIHNTNECLQNDDAIKVKCEICSSSFVSLKAFLDHLKKSPRNQESHNQQQLNDNENIPFVSTTDSSQNHTPPLNLSESSIDNDVPSPIESNYNEDSNSDNESQDSDLDSGEDLESGESDSNTVTMNKVRVGTKLFKWKKPRTFQVRKIIFDSKSSSNNSNIFEYEGQIFQTSHICSCGREFKSAANLQNHSKRMGHEMPLRKKFICTLCSPSSATEVEEINEDSNTTNTASSLVATTTTETSSSNSVIGFKSKKDLKAHIMAEHPGQKILKCAVDTCSETFWEYYDLQLHLIRQHNILQKFECKICLDEGKKNATFRLTSELHQHFRERHQSRTKIKASDSTAKKKEHISMLCPVCFPTQETETENNHQLNSLNTDSSLEEHQEGRKEQEGTEIPNADGPEKVVYTNLHKLIRHMQTAHPNGPKMFKCTHPGCTRDFYSKFVLKCHLFFHGPQSDYPYKCDFEGCDRRFVHRHALFAHQKDHSEETLPKFVCHICSKEYKELKNFKNHVKSHDAEFACQHCPMKFNYATNLKRHTMIIHQGLKPFKCGFCDREFAQKVQAQAHESSQHTGEKRHACLLCDKKYACPTAFAKHKAKVHSLFPTPRNRTQDDTSQQQPAAQNKKPKQKKKAVCSECGFVCGNHQSLKNHLYHEHGIGSKTFLCSSCGRAYLTLYQLNVHIRRSHDEEQKKKIRARNRLLERSRHRTSKKVVGTKKPKAKSRPPPSLSPYKCSSCPTKAFNSQSGLTRHLKMHNRESLLNCTFPGCRSSFTSNYRLYRHTLTHQDQNQTTEPSFPRHPSPTFHLNDESQEEEEEEELETQEVESIVDLEDTDSIVVFREEEMDEQQDSYDSD